ncbi:uncharacterized protein LOC100907026, partial [Galendromus occidentalis]|uniref:Uncharacterized protein LOC100907026 n=1 Tax=Galendromus occidentalis TaxID=34638 RepID=A0AAJ7SE28_9ACAR
MLAARACFKCLKLNHDAKHCREGPKTKCRYCNASHYAIICPKAFKNQAGKPQRSVSTNINVDSLETDVLSTDGTVLLCKICEKEISSDKKFLVSQHISSVKHKSLAERKKQSASPSLIQMRPFLEASGKQSQFYVDLCDAFVSAGIPLRKLDSEKFSYFLEKYCGQQVPSSVTLRLHYLKNIYEKKLEFIRRCVSDKPIWVSIDETTDATGRYVANTVIGLLTATENRSFLLHAEDLERTNSSTVAQAFMNALSILWPGGVKHERVLLFVTDAAPYMTKAGKALKVIFPRMIHVTCVVHALHRVAEE